VRSQSARKGEGGGKATTQSKKHLMYVRKNTCPTAHAAGGANGRKSKMEVVEQRKKRPPKSKLRKDEVGGDRKMDGRNRELKFFLWWEGVFGVFGGGGVWVGGLLFGGVGVCWGGLGVVWDWFQGDPPQRGAGSTSERGGAYGRGNGRSQGRFASVKGDR